MTKVFSGVQPTGDGPHIGNYIGAFRQWVALQEEYEAFFCVVDLHSMTAAWDPAELAKRTRQTVATLMACGIDPDRSVLFAQSDVPEHTNLTWLLTCIARMGELGRMTQFKDKSRGRESESVGAGLFMYPVLMAADVLVYRAQRVPVGEDQRQHLELMRVLAQRFNRQFGDTFPVPEALIPKQGARIMALDDPTQKMSKSEERPGSNIWMLDEPDVVRRKISRAVTDSGRDVRYGPDKPAISNLLDIYASVSGRSIDELVAAYGEGGYATLKSDLAEAVIEFLQPFQHRYAELTDDWDQVEKVMDLGADKAREAAAETMALVRERVGFRRA